MRPPVAHLLLSNIPRAPARVDTTTLVRILAQAGVQRTARAVQGQLRRLCAELPLRCVDRTKPHQWQWMAGATTYEFPPMGAHTALTLKMAHAYLAPLLPPSTLAAMKGQLQRADEVLRANAASKVATWSRKVRVFPRGFNLLPPRVQPEIVAAVYTALLKERRFEATYRRRGRTEDERYDVNPLGLVVRGSLLVLVCTLGKSKNLRQLHLHRMSEPRLLETQAHAPDGFDLDAHIARGNLSFLVDEEPVSLRLLFSAVAAQTVEESPVAADQRLTRRDDGRVELEATVANTLELSGWIKSYGPYVEVLGPERLREEIALEARETAEVYAKKPAAEGA
jgi:predicted DNA-binding transcriptional regulator YafY